MAARTTVRHIATPCHPYNAHNNHMRHSTATKNATTSATSVEAAADPLNIAPRRTTRNPRTHKPSTQPPTQGIQPTSTPVGTATHPIDLTDTLSESSALINKEDDYIREAKQYAVNQKVLDAVTTPASSSAPSFAAIQEMARSAKDTLPRTTAWVAALPDVSAAHRVSDFGACVTERRAGVISSGGSTVADMASVLGLEFRFWRELRREEGLLERWIDREGTAEMQEDVFFGLVY